MAGGARQHGAVAQSGELRRRRPPAPVLGRPEPRVARWQRGGTATLGVAGSGRYRALFSNLFRGDAHASATRLRCGLFASEHRPPFFAERGSGLLGIFATLLRPHEIEILPFSLLPLCSYGT